MTRGEGGFGKLARIMRSRVLGRTVSLSYAVVILILVTFLIGSALMPQYNNSYYYSDIRAIEAMQCTVDGESIGEVRIPATFDGLAPGDKVVLTGAIEARTLDNLLINLSGSCLELYVNDRLYYSVGEPGSYPDFQKTPPNVVTSVALPTSPQLLQLRLEYMVPAVGDKIVVSTIYQGDKSLLFRMISDRFLILTILAAVMFIASLVLLIIGLVSLRRTSMAMSFIWLGTTCLAASVWTLSVDELMLYLMPQTSSIVYSLGYIGMFSIMPPFIRFNMVMFKLRRLSIQAASHVASAYLIVVLILHVSGAVPFVVSSDALYILIPVVVAMFLFGVVRQYLSDRRFLPVRFLVSCFVLVVFIALEMASMAMGHYMPPGLLFMVGLISFVFELSTLAWSFVNEALDASERNMKLESEIAMSNRALEAQRSLYETLMTSNEEVRKLRHDMRHQLTVIRGYLEHTDDGETAREGVSYIDSLIGSIPKAVDTQFCDNFAINALVAHYFSRAAAMGVQVEACLDIPEDTGAITVNDLSVVIGNLLENAIEACAYVEAHKRFIKMRTSVSNKRLTLVMDNSYDGQLDVRDGQFYSRKRPGLGIGMQSIRTEIKKYAGTLDHETADGVFKTSLYMKLEQPSASPPAMSARDGQAASGAGGAKADGDGPSVERRQNAQRRKQEDRRQG
jgi:signal transduction histidine kinase